MWLYIELDTFALKYKLWKWSCHAWKWMTYKSLSRLLDLKLRKIMHTNKIEKNPIDSLSR